MLRRIADPTEGSVRLGDRDLRELSRAEWLRQIAWVPQAPYLFAGSLADNIRLGDRQAGDEAVLRAARDSGVLEFAGGLPEGLDSLVGERGLTLSSGQRQRVALARALLRDAPVWLLDEPTARLDATTAAAVGTARPGPDGQGAERPGQGAGSRRRDVHGLVLAGRRRHRLGSAARRGAG